MSGSVNRVHLSGRLGADPVITTLDDGKRIARFPLATSERWIDKGSGEPVRKTQWHAVVIWNRSLVKTVEAHLKKGSAVYLEGRLQTRHYTNSRGAKTYITEVVIRPRGGVLIMPPRQRGADTPASDTPAADTPASGTPALDKQAEQRDPAGAPLTYVQASGR